MHEPLTGVEENTKASKTKERGFPGTERGSSSEARQQRCRDPGRALDMAVGETLLDVKKGVGGHAALI